MANVSLFEIGDFPNIDYSGRSRRDVEDVLKPVSISFSVENVSRATTHEICESNDSFTQQSMRYVKMSDDSFIVPPGLSPTLRREFEGTMNTLLANYMRLSELKKEFKGRGGRPQADWFMFAPIEDNRYALSLASPSNILVTMGGDKLLNFFGSLSRSFESDQIMEALAPFLPKGLEDLCRAELGSKDFAFIEAVHRDKLDKALTHPYVDIEPGRFERAGLGALTSTNEKPPSELLAEYEAEGCASERLCGVAERVLGYNHDSIIEHARQGFGLGMSFVTYHQFERHRLPSNVREDFRGVPLGRTVLVPPRISNTPEGVEIFQQSVSAARSLREKMLNDAYGDNHLALLNGNLMGVYSTMNAKAFYGIANERLCNNAQWEIQGLMESMALRLRESEGQLYAPCAPKCISGGGCPEGKLSCGRYSEVKAKYTPK